MQPRAGTVFTATAAPALTARKASITSVSYTHLRAHETVLDLVCRLLLEKKKTKVTYTIRNTEEQKPKQDTY